MPVSEIPLSASGLRVCREGSQDLLVSERFLHQTLMLVSQQRDLSVELRCFRRAIRDHAEVLLDGTPVGYHGIGFTLIRHSVS